MTLAGSHQVAAEEYLALTVTLLETCRGYFTDCAPTMARAMTTVAELEAGAARRGHPSSALARRWRNSDLFPLARELRDGLAGVRLMVESAATAAGNAAAELGYCGDDAQFLARRTMIAHRAFAELTAVLTTVDGLFRELRTEPWSLPDRLVVEFLRRKVASGDLTRAGRELARAAELLERVLINLS